MKEHFRHLDLFDFVLNNIQTFKKNAINRVQFKYKHYKITDAKILYPCLNKDSRRTRPQHNSFQEAIQCGSSYILFKSQDQTCEKIWRFMFLVVSVVFAFLVNKIYIYQTQPTFDAFRRGQFWNMISYGIPYAIFYTMLDWLVHFLFDGLCEKYYISHATYANPEARKKRCYTLVKWGFSVFYYGFASLACFLLIRNTSYFPTWLGGTGSPMNVYNDFPQNSQFAASIQVYYLAQFGKHFSRMFVHFFIRPQGNFYEFGLHHTLSVFLIIFSYLMDHWLIGCFVLLIHDFTDLALILARAYKDFRYRSQKVLLCFYIFAFFSWIACRIFIFGYAFIYALDYGILNVLTPKLQNQLGPLYLETMYFPAWFMSGMLKVLQVLQFFWTYYIVRSYISVAISSKLATHNYD